MKEVIYLKNIVAGYKKNRPIINGVTTSFNLNEIKVIMGTSGGGKSTLIKSIVGLASVFSGEIYFMGKNFLNLSYKNKKRLLKNIGFMFQNGALIGSYKLWENVAVPLVIHSKLPRDVIQDIAYYKLKSVGLEDAYYKLPSELSGGMLKRAAIARALALDPKILFCDEPSAGLDPITSKKIDHLLLELKEELKLSIIVISHQIDSILRIADNILFLNQGKKIFDGSKKDALQSDNELIKNYFMEDVGVH